MRVGGLTDQRRVTFWHFVDRYYMASHQIVNPGKCIWIVSSCSTNTMKPPISNSFLHDTVQASPTTYPSRQTSDLSRRHGWSLVGQSCTPRTLLLKSGCPTQSTWDWVNIVLPHFLTQEKSGNLKWKVHRRLCLNKNFSKMFIGLFRGNNYKHQDQSN